MEKLGLGDSCKLLEMAEAGRCAMPRLPLMARLDGRAFHSLTRKFERPFDKDMGDSMQQTMIELVDEFKPACAYTQSDEITMAWLEPCVFDGRFQKLTSILAGYASAVFDKLLTARKGELRQVACFDCRVWQVPTIQDVMDVFVWREDDAVKNSLTMAAQSVYSHKQLMGVQGPQKHEMLHAKGINWDKYPAHFKRGVYAKRVTVERPMSEEELAKLPPKAVEKARGAVIRRSSVEILNMPPIRKFKEASRVLLGVDIEGVSNKYEVTCANPLYYQIKEYGE